MSVTIKDIAKKANTSVSTVSKALNNKKDISDAVKNKIQKIAIEMGYNKNILASRLVSKKSNTIGVFFLSRFKEKRKSESAANKYINTMLDEIQNKGYDLILFSINSDITQNKSYIELCKERQVEGAIFIGFQDDDPYISEIESSKIPIVMIERSSNGNRVSSIKFDNKEGITQALEYLTSLNHTKIAFIRGETKSEPAQERFQYYKEFMRKKDIYNENLVYEGDYTLKEGYNLGLLISKYKQKPTAVLSSNDLMAIGLMKAFNEKDILIPDDISVIGYDNFEISKYTTPRLTTISQDFNLVATTAIKLILDMIKNNADSQNIVITQNIIKRESCLIRNCTKK